MISAHDTYVEALRQWGFEEQSRMLQEECAEAIVAVNKLSRAHDDGEKERRIDELAEEVADVLIMAGQIRVALGADRVSHHYSEKLKRLQGRLGMTP